MAKSSLGRQWAAAPIDQAIREVTRELYSALDRFPPFNTPHEGKAVIEEELDELWEHVKANTGRSLEARKEAIQVAAMALRYATDLCDTLEAYGWLASSAGDTE